MRLLAISTAILFASAASAEEFKLELLKNCNGVSALPIVTHIDKAEVGFLKGINDINTDIRNYDMSCRFGISPSGNQPQDQVKLKQLTEKKTAIEKDYKDLQLYYIRLDKDLGIVADKLKNDGAKDCANELEGDRKEAQRLLAAIQAGQCNKANLKLDLQNIIR